MTSRTAIFTMLTFALAIVTTLLNMGPDDLSKALLIAAGWLILGALVALALFNNASD